MPFQQEAKAGRDMVEKFVNKPYDHVKSEMVCSMSLRYGIPNSRRYKAAGVAPPSLVQDLLSGSHPASAELENRIKWTAGALYGGE